MAVLQLTALKLHQRFMKIRSRKYGREENTKKMIKKTSELKTTPAARNEEVVAVNNTKESTPSIEKQAMAVEHPQLQEINSIIHEWLTDMWLLTTGEDLSADSLNGKKQNGRPLAIDCDGQLKLTSSRDHALAALRTVGIEMS